MVKSTQTFIGIVRKDPDTDFGISFDKVSGFTTAEDEAAIPKYVDDFLTAAVGSGSDFKPELEDQLNTTEKDPLDVIAEHAALDGDGIVGYTVTHVTMDDESDEEPTMETAYHSTVDLG